LLELDEDALGMSETFRSSGIKFSVANIDVLIYLKEHCEIQRKMVLTVPRIKENIPLILNQLIVGELREKLLQVKYKVKDARGKQLETKDFDFAMSRSQLVTRRANKLFQPSIRNIRIVFYKSIDKSVYYKLFKPSMSYKAMELAVENLRSLEITKMKFQFIQTLTKGKKEKLWYGPKRFEIIQAINDKEFYETEIARFSTKNEELVDEIFERMRFREI
jgi:hypothetical protein